MATSSFRYHCIPTQGCSSIGPIFSGKDGYNAPPKTWEELATMAKKIQDGERGKQFRGAFRGFVLQGKAPVKRQRVTAGQNGSARLSGRPG